MSRGAVEREPVTIEGPAGRLQALLETARGSDPDATAAVCHPHPQYHGTMDNKVAFTLARAAVESGAAALRFNFRGVGRSEGSYGGGRGEVEDLRAAEAWLGRRFPETAKWRLGFSFGSAVAIARSLQDPCDVLVTVAPPVEAFESYAVGSGEPRAGRWLVVQGDADEVVDPDAVAEWVRTLRRPPELRVLRGAGHFFHGRLTELRDIVRETLDAPALAEGG